MEESDINHQYCPFQPFPHGHLCTYTLIEANKVAGSGGGRGRDDKIEERR